jgi:nucleoid-associated protein YgaU
MLFQVNHLKTIKDWSPIKMIKNTFVRLIALTLATGLVVGCASGPSAEEEAAAAEAATVAATSAAESRAAQAAIDEASAAVAEARGVGALPAGTAELVAQAQAALAAGDSAAAMELAAQARDRANAGVTEYYSRLARGEYDSIAEYTNLTADQISRLRAGEAAWNEGDRRTAYEIFSALSAELAAAHANYTVMGGDSLWSIASGSETYGNAYAWPLIYKQNADQIEDADLIFPGQEFDIDTNPTRAAAEAAMEHARNRGAWTIGETEASDTAYLNSN